MARLIPVTAALGLAGMMTLALAADPIKIGVAGPFTGGSSSMGVSMRDGVRLAIDEINKSGGVLGRQLVAVERDDEAKNERGVQIAHELINKEKVVATVGYINTGVALASQRFFQEAKIPVMNNVATGSIVTHQFDKEPENYVFRNAAHDSIQAPMIVEEAITRRGFKKVAILADSTNYGQLGRQDLEASLKAKGDAGRGREVQHQGRGHDRATAEGQGAEVFRIIERLKSEGVTMLLVEQFAAAALGVADYGYVLENGRISVHGPADRLRDDPAVKAAYLGGASH